MQATDRKHVLVLCVLCPTRAPSDLRTVCSASYFLRSWLLPQHQMLNLRMLQKSQTTVSLFDRMAVSALVQVALVV